MRLIDADKLLELIKEQKEREIGGYTKGINAGLNIAKSIINDKTQTPTAYDVDKVVEQLSDRSTLSRPVGWSKSYEIVTLKDAIEIVKQGGKEQQWNRNTVPKCDVGKYSDEVLATVEYIGCDGKIYRRVIKAVYYQSRYHTQGCWYEVCDYSEDDYSYSEITDRVTAWMKLPKPYEPGVKEFGGVEDDSMEP